VFGHDLVAKRLLALMPISCAMIPTSATSSTIIASPPHKPQPQSQPQPLPPPPHRTPNPLHTLQTTSIQLPTQNVQPPPHPNPTINQAPPPRTPTLHRRTERRPPPAGAHQRRADPALGSNTEGGERERIRRCDSYDLLLCFYRQLSGRELYEVHGATIRI